MKEVPVPIDPKLAEEQRKKGWAITNVERFDAIRLNGEDRTADFRAAVVRNAFAAP